MDIETADDVVQDEQLDEATLQADELAQGETPEGQQPATESDDQNADDGVIVTIGDETPPAANDDEVDGKPAPQWVKELRKSDREKAKRIRELEQQVAASKQASQPQAIEVGEKPTLENCDYDAEAYAQKLLDWNDRKRKADEMAASARAEQEAAAAAWQKRIDTYRANSAALKVDDFEGAEHVVQSTLNQVQQGVILHGADKPELLVYALGNNPAKAKELAAINDPVRFAFAVAKLEAQLKVQPRKAPPAPERTVRGTTGGATPVDNVLARLEAEADRTGDRTKIREYRDEQRRKAAQAA